MIERLKNAAHKIARFLLLKIGRQPSLEMLPSGEWLVYRFGKRIGPIKSYDAAASIAFDERITLNASVVSAPWIAQGGGVNSLDVVKHQLNQRRNFKMQLAL